MKVNLQGAVCNECYVEQWHVVLLMLANVMGMMLEPRPKVLGLLGYKGESVNLVTIWGGKQQMHRADRAMVWAGARLGRQGVRERHVRCGVQQGVAYMHARVSYNILLKSTLQCVLESD
jgi:hypothetical protein